MIAFLTSENKNLQLEDLPLADFGRLLERLLLSVRTKSNKNFVNLKLLTTVVFVIMIQRIFPS